MSKHLDLSSSSYGLSSLLFNQITEDLFCTCHQNGFVDSLVSSGVGDWMWKHSLILKWRPVLGLDLQLALISCFTESASCFMGKENATAP